MITNTITLIALRLCLATETDYGTNIPPGGGDQGRAQGILQMWPAAVDEANRLIPHVFPHLPPTPTPRVTWSYEDRHDPQRSRAMCLVTLEFHRRRLNITCPVKLASRWRNPYSNHRCPEWHMKKLRREYDKLKVHKHRP